VANRLTKIYTRSGDGGLTRLATGEQVAKTSTRIGVCGDLDETNSAIGLVLCATGVPGSVHRTLSDVQQDLFDLGAELALPSQRRATEEHVQRLEKELDQLNATLPPLKEFVLPGGTPAAAACHLARAICRRTERSAWRLAEETELSPFLLRYLNRLSDLLFVIARVLARQDSPDEPLWQPDRGTD
jgi:cob(I)alamin adenosyltransferase